MGATWPHVAQRHRRIPSAAAEAESRATRFMGSALAILGETGRTDFTVLEVVERSKTSLRAFYQHFATKDELLLALVEKIMADATDALAYRNRRRCPAPMHCAG